MSTPTPTNLKPVTLVVAADDAGRRLDQVLADQLPDHSRSYLQRVLKAGRVTLNGVTVKKTTTVKAGDALSVDLPPPPDLTPRPEPFAFPILDEDADLLVINKPAGLVVHPGAGTTEGTLVNALLAYDPDAFTDMLDENVRPGIVHRLDKDTSGVLVVARHPGSKTKLSAAFADRTTTKVYLALALGTLSPPNATVDEPIGRHPVQRHRMAVRPSDGRQALSHVRTLAAGSTCSLVAVHIETGRTHQIRVHLAHIGHPVLGDAVYGRGPTDAAPRQMLHAWRLTVPHPADGELRTWLAPLPADFLAALEAEGILADAATQAGWLEAATADQ